jgi:hypothetical protein
MAALQHRNGGRTILAPVAGPLLAAALVCLTAAPALAQGTPLPLTRPSANVPNTTGSVGAPPSARGKVSNPAPQGAPQMAQSQAPAPASNPFAALLGKPGAASGSLTAEQRTIITRINSYLSAASASNMTIPRRSS